MIFHAVTTEEVIDRNVREGIWTESRAEHFHHAAEKTREILDAGRLSYAECPLCGVELFAVDSWLPEVCPRCHGLVNPWWGGNQA
jgi:rubrerythrin